MGDSVENPAFKYGVALGMAARIFLKTVNPTKIVFGTVGLDLMPGKETYLPSDLDLREQIEQKRHIEVHCMATRKDLPNLPEDIRRTARFLNAIRAQRWAPYIVGITHQDMARVAGRFGADSYPVGARIPGDKVEWLSMMHGVARKMYDRPFELVTPQVVVMPTAEFIELGQQMKTSAAAVS